MEGPPASLPILEDLYRLNPGVPALLACLLEAGAPKPGNVHPDRAFADASYADFEASASAIVPALSRAPARPLGQTILEAVIATRKVTESNTNLGLILLFSPLAAAYGGPDRPAGIDALRQAVRSVLSRTTFRDAELAYEAILLANPGGLGDAAEWDVRGPPGGTLTEMMVLAADRDLVARQYANGFEEALVEGPAALVEALRTGHTRDQAIVLCHLGFIARHGDSLIARKVGPKASQEAARRAAVVLAAGWPAAARSGEAFAELDAWLRADGNRRNPGATADLVAASLFAALANGIIKMR